MTPTPPEPSNEGKIITGLREVQKLSIANVLVIALLVIIAIPVYVIWKALGDEKLLNRLMSQYEERADSTGCLVRHVQARGGPSQWGISSGFAFQGGDRWFVSVVMARQPTPEEIESYCAALKLLADQIIVDPDGVDDSTHR